MLFPAAGIDAPLPAEFAACKWELSLPIHTDAVVEREILADVNEDGTREVITGYTRPDIEEAYLHVRFVTGWSTRVRLDHLELVTHTQPMPEGVVVMGDEPVIVVNAGGIAVGSKYVFIVFRDCALGPLLLTSGEFPDIWVGNGIHHSEWFTCRGDGVVQVQAFREDADSDLYETAKVTFYERDGTGFAAGVELAVDLPLAWDELRSMFPPCPVHGTFVDDDGSDFESDIEWMAARRFARGCDPPTNDRYCPDDPVTRGQMAALLSRALRLPATDADHFTDDDDSIFEGDINRLAVAGITRGCDPPANDRYCPDDPVTRGQMAALLSRALRLPATDPDHFTDDNGIIFEGDINKLAAAGITRGCDPPANNHYCPHVPVTRAQMAALLHRALE